MRWRATLAWAAYLIPAAALALYAVAQWLLALVNRTPVLYGEGAVANAARLARDGIAYLDPDPSRFVAANYPPLYFHLASIGDPFVSGRIASIAATLLVAALVFVMARPAALVAATALGAGWLALAPVMVWGPALKPDLVALALTALAVVLLDRRRELAPIAGFALVFAALAKPTALLPAAALLAWLAWSDRATLVRCGFGAAVAVVAAAVTVYLDSVPDIWRHVVTWNALPWSLEQVLSIAFIGVLVVGIPLGLAIFIGGVGGARAAYLAGALGIVVAGGREGATINYLLDLSMAIMLSIAAAAPMLRSNALIPLALLAQLVVGTFVVDPLRVVPGRIPTTGAWSDQLRGGTISLAFRIDGRYLVEDSGLLAQSGIPPVVDDLFLWSRLVERGIIDADPILSQVRDGRIDTVIAQTDLDHLDAAPGFERQRWAPTLVRAVLDRYRLAHHVGDLWIYEPR
ncbi:MAG TPA: hypothetical protein VKE23_12245 [Candidatus Limnocylindria bacterium]|nr:hypothetical protein [Candidatus Limnocylindria bacterium]